MRCNTRIIDGNTIDIKIAKFNSDKIIDRETDQAPSRASEHAENEF